MVPLARFVLRRRRLVIVLALLMIPIGGYFGAAQATNRLGFDFSLPGEPGYETDKAVVATFGTSMSNLVVPVVTVPEGQTVQGNREAIGRAFAAAEVPDDKNPGGRVVDFATTGDPAFVTSDGRSTYALVALPNPTGFTSTASPAVGARISDALATAVPGATVTLTGLDELASGGDSSGPGVLVETLIGALGALAVLAFVFASFMALIPLLIAAVSIVSTLLIVVGITYLTDVSFIVQFLVSLIGLGVAIDYSLLLVVRWREERAHGRSNDDAVLEAMRTAGRAVVASAGTVVIGLFALVVLPVPFLRSIGLGGILIPLVSALVSLTLLPALLAGIGPRLDRRRLGRTSRRRSDAEASRGWVRWSRLVVRRRSLAAAVAGVLLVLLALPLLSINVGLAKSDSLASSGPAYEALQTLENNGLSSGLLTPAEILVRGGDPAAVAAAARSVPGVRAAVAPPASSVRDGVASVVVIPEQETVAGGSTKVITALKERVGGLPGVVGVSGAGALQIDYLDAVYGNFPLVLAVIVIFTFLLLVRAFRSVLLPLKAVLLNLLSVGATFGAMTLFWQEGYGSKAVFGIEATGAITFWLPLMIFAFLFGLSMDYEVFILARMREEYDRTGATDLAAVEGMARTGRLVTSAALILFLAFISLASGPETDIKVFATGLGFGILLDATIVRALLVPALVSLFGRYNWWLPSGLARILRVAPSAAAHEPPRREQLAAADALTLPRQRDRAADPEPEPVSRG